MGNAVPSTDYAVNYFMRPRGQIVVDQVLVHERYMFCRSFNAD